jgi:circadian clock protein KaiC
VNGAKLFNEPGVFMSFEEPPEELEANCATLGYDLGALLAAGTMAIDHVRVERGEIDEAGEYDLEGLFIRLGLAADSIGAKRVVLDTIETLFSGFSDMAVLRAEMRRLFGWMKDRGLTVIVTGESGIGQMTRHGLEEYVSDCVICLDNRVEDQIATRRLRIAKYRGSAHGTNEYPFLIDAEGISVLPVTSSGLRRPVSSEIVSSGIPGLDGMVGNRGFFRGASILLSGVAGAGKTTISASFIDAACARGERAMFFLFEESAGEVCRNLLSVGLDLQGRVDSGLLRFEEARPSLFGLETHLARMHRDIDEFKPAVVVVDPLSAFRGPAPQVLSALIRMVNLLKSRGITALFTSLWDDGGLPERSDDSLSSLMDSWVRLVDLEANGERSRLLYIIKSRGASHSNQVREYRITNAGIDLIDVYIGPDGVLTGTARITQEARESAATERRRQDVARRMRELGRRRVALERQIAELRASLEAEAEEAQALLADDAAIEETLKNNRNAIAALRGAAQ